MKHLRRKAPRPLKYFCIMGQQLSFAQSVHLLVSPQELAAFIVPSEGFTWNKSLLKVVCAKSAGICFTLWKRCRKRHLKMMMEITDFRYDTESRYKLKTHFLLHCISSMSALILAFLTNFVLLFLITAISGVTCYCTKM